LGKVRKSHLRTIESAIESFYGIECAIMPAVPVKDGLLFDGEGTYDASRILSNYDSEERVVFVTTKRIARRKFRDERQNLKGMAQMWGEKSVVSTYYMTKYFGDSKAYRDDLSKTALHEVGYTFGLTHCDILHCVMYTSDTYHPPVDARKLTFCESCRNNIGMPQVPRVR
jgi:predicted Zn-dependent protease